MATNLSLQFGFVLEEVAANSFNDAFSEVQRGQPTT